MSNGEIETYLNIDYKETLIKPNSLLFFFKRINETLFYYVTFDKKNYDRDLEEERFKEFIYIVNYQKPGFYEETRSRYITTLENYIYKYGKDDFVKSLSLRLPLLRYIRDRYPANSFHWLTVEQVIYKIENIL